VPVPVPAREAVQWQQLRHQRVRELQRLVQERVQGLRRVQGLAPRRQLVQERVLVQGLRRVQVLAPRRQRVRELQRLVQERVLVQGLRRVQVLAPRRQLVLEQRGQVRDLRPGQVPLSALPEVRWTQPYTVFFLLSACLADYVRGSVASGQRYPQKSCHTSQFRRLGRS
jgi:hypothetical protein